jgi:DNA-binding transcriptional LysR family regulator
MHGIDGSLDLNLLGVLDVLLDERSVTRAGKRLGLTQSTVSHALSRLRSMLADPLFVRSGREIVPTPRAEALGPALKRVLADARRLVREETAFDPATSTRSFILVCPDAMAAFVPGILRTLGETAPFVRLEVRPPVGLDVASSLALGSADLALLPPRDDGAGLVQRAIGAATWCIVARRNHPGVKRGKIDRETWVRYPHVQVGTGGGGAGFVAEALRGKGVERRVGFIAPGFLAAPFAVAQTDFFFAAPRELVAPIASQLGLVLLEPPVSLPPVRVAMIWHERMHADAGHRWLRELVSNAAAALLRPKATSRTGPRTR